MDSIGWVDGRDKLEIGGRQLSHAGWIADTRCITDRKRTVDTGWMPDTDWLADISSIADTEWTTDNGCMADYWNDG